LDLDQQVRRLESQAELQISNGLGPSTAHGLVLRAVRGEPLLALADFYQLDAGDIYGRLTETEMWLRQLEGALLVSGLDDDLAQTSRRARHLLRERAGLLPEAGAQPETSLPLPSIEEHPAPTAPPETGFARPASSPGPRTRRRKR
jgi:hypothetical protein